MADKIMTNTNLNPNPNCTNPLAVALDIAEYSALRKLLTYTQPVLGTGKWHY